MELKRWFVVAGVVFVLPCLLATDARASRSLTESGGGSRMVRVNCATGQKIARALERRAEALVVEFKGTCEELINIERDDVILRGADPSATIVGRVWVLGSSRVTLEGFTVRDTEGDDPFSDQGDGIRIVSSMRATLRDLKVQDTGRRGVSLEDSSADLSNVTVLRAGGAGIFGVASAANLYGEIAVHDGATAGILVVNTSHFFVRRDATVTANGNAIGIVVQVNAVMTVSNVTTITTDDNLFLGFLVTSQGDVDYGETAIRSRNNGGPGLLVSELSNWTPFVGSPATVTITGNAGAGIVVERGGFVELRAGTEVVNNDGTGISVQDSRIVLGGSQIQGHAGGDLVMGFGTRAIFDVDNQIGTLSCDGTVLTQGALSCPAP